MEVNQPSRHDLSETHVLTLEAIADMDLDDMDLRTPEPSQVLALFAPGPLDSPIPEHAPCHVSRSITLPSRPAPSTLLAVTCENLDGAISPASVLSHNGCQQAATSVDSGGYASAADWNSHKEIIHELYMARNLNLTEVVSMMKIQHNFKAT